MSLFRTAIPKLVFPFEIDHSSAVLCIGSCFAENMSNKLMDSKFSTLLNPFGILYNPHSVGNVLERILEEKLFTEDQLFKGNGLWHSFDHHGHFSNPEKKVALASINKHISQAALFLKEADRLILTFGTSNVFVYKKNQKIVANCHKVSNQEFDRKALSTDAVIEKLTPIFKKLKTNNPKLEILLSVSPVRHIRDGLIENQRSKARLLVACDELCNDLNFVHYFPSYEILMDDLRDYRFYNADMIHPSDLAIDYVWEYFGQCFFNKKTQSVHTEITKIRNAAKHKPFHMESEEHQRFIIKQLELIEVIETTLSAVRRENASLDFSIEKEFFKKNLLKN